MEKQFDGKRALVTGAGKGIGRDVAKELVKCGAVTYALSRTQSDLDSLKEEVPDIHTIAVDLADWDATQKAVESIGPIDLLVNNAGINIPEPMLEIKKESYDSIMNINVRSCIQVSQIVAKTMVSRKCGGAIVNLSSQASMIALTNHAVYSASKASIDAITKNMAFELGPHKIRCNAVNPTVVLTELGKRSWSAPERSGPLINRIPLRKFAEVEDVVNAVIFLLSDKAAMISGTCLPVDGGFLIAGV
ncbi:L-xylulose reductase-like [Saccoglossus kowalevskii]|uniref:L-xylulose reductase-like n=1 Tax=Saccoglossus kowalevskii TaxID=10224 RepID=A0ABM0GJG1_SACKO|nr:PREDICTED: L-xylulose reductase-like [Saccoglossus kowalevskii]